MSRLQQQSGEDYPEAVLKHCDDARCLLNRGRSDGAGYLAGYAVECTLKTLVQVEGMHSDLVKGHDLNKLSAKALKLVGLTTSRTARHVKNPNVTTLPYSENPGPGGWRETIRYHPVGLVPLVEAQRWVEEAERLYLEVIGELQKDGEI